MDHLSNTSAPWREAGYRPWVVCEERMVSAMRSSPHTSATCALQSAPLLLCAPLCLHRPLVRVVTVSGGQRCRYPPPGVIEPIARKEKIHTSCQK